MEFTYDPFCRRVIKRVSVPRERWDPPVPVDVTRYVWDGDLLVHAIRKRATADGDPIVEERTFCFEDERWAPLAHRDVVVQGDTRHEGPWQTYLNNGAETPEALIGPDGTLAGEIERSAWGMPSSRPVGATTPIGFAGQLGDEETGLFYHRFRYYDPERGTFISPDPIGFGGGLQTYGYVPDPLGWIDPLGLVKTANMRVGDNLERKRMAELQGPNTEVVSHKVGSNNGIDITVIKRDAQGNVVSVRLEECKANSSRLGMTNHGRQMSDPWLDHVLDKMRSKGRCAKQTAETIKAARDAGILEKVVVRGKQSKPGGRWKMFPPKKIP